MVLKMKKKLVLILGIVILVLVVISSYVFIVKPYIQNLQTDAYDQGVINVIGWIDNQIQINNQSQINLPNRQIICYGN